MNACFLDVLHDACDDTGLSIRDGIHVNLDGVLQKLVNKDRMFGRGLDGALGELFQDSSSYVISIARPPRT